jgi:type IV secretory pathway TrbL component
MRRRTIGWVLIAYGVIGVVLLVAGAITGMGAAARIERTAVVAGGTLSAAARATRAAADSFTSIDGSLAEAQSSADMAADLSRDASATLDSLAAAMGIMIFGSQPLAPLAVEFSTSADQADQLAETLDSVSGSMSETRTDVAAIGVELDSLSDQLESLEITTDPTGGTPPLRLFIGLLLAWLAAPAIGAIVVGAVLLRTPRPVVVD